MLPYGDVGPPNTSPNSLSLHRIRSTTQQPFCRGFVAVRAVCCSYTLCDRLYALDTMQGGPQIFFQGSAQAATIMSWRFPLSSLVRVLLPRCCCEVW